MENEYSRADPEGANDCFPTSAVQLSPLCRTTQVCPGDLLPTPLAAARDRHNRRNQAVHIMRFAPSEHLPSFSCFCLFIIGGRSEADDS